VVLAVVLLAAPPLAAANGAPERPAALAQASLLDQGLQGLRALLAHFLPVAAPIGKAERPHGASAKSPIRVFCDNTGTMDPNGGCAGK
jgi:hypothetical protein